MTWQILLGMMWLVKLDVKTSPRPYISRLDKQTVPDCCRPSLRQTRYPPLSFFLGWWRPNPIQVPRFASESDSWIMVSLFCSCINSVCCFVWLNWYWEIVYGPSVSSKAGRGQGVRTHEMDRQRTTSPCPLLENLGWPDPHLHLNYVAGYTDPLLFLFERTQQLTPLTTRGFCPGGSVSGQVQSSFGLIGEGPEWW